MKVNELEILVDSIKSLPGIGSKNAKKIAQFIVNQDNRFVEQFCNNIKIAKMATKRCIGCNILTRLDKCIICSNETRDKTKLCVVSENEDAIKIEQTNAFNGLYYIT
jgi:recombination protein RecR